MAGSCPVPGPDDPLVRSLLGVVDCNVRDLVHSGYATLFQGNGGFATVLTALLTLYVAIMGYRLLLGRTQIRVSDFALNAVKLGVVIALATQWDTYQTVVYDLLFRGPEQLASMITSGLHPDSALFQGDVFDGLQVAFDDLTNFGSGYASHAPAAASPLLGGAGFAAFMLTLSATILLLSSLGVVLVAKIVLGLLLATGPVFIALLLFESTRGVFEGWLRASLAFAFAPLAAIVLLSVALIMLEPSLLQMEALQKQHIYTLAPAYGVMTMILVFAGVAGGALIAGGMIAAGFRLPRISTALPRQNGNTATQGQTMIVLTQSRAARVASAATALDRRDVATLVSESRSTDRRTTAAPAPNRTLRDGADASRLGQEPSQRRISGLSSGRPNARIAR